MLPFKIYGACVIPACSSFLLVYSCVTSDSGGISALIEFDMKRLLLSVEGKQNALQAWNFPWRAWDALVMVANNTCRNDTVAEFTRGNVFSRNYQKNSFDIVL